MGSAAGCGEASERPPHRCVSEGVEAGGEWVGQGGSSRTKAAGQGVMTVTAHGLCWAEGWRGRSAGSL